MTDLERKYIDLSKEKDFVLKVEDLTEIKEQLEPEDAAALIAMCAFRASLNDAEEGRALWRFIRYITEIEMPLQIVDFTGMLFPGNEAYYSKSLTPTAFKMIQQQAALMIANEKYDDEEHKEWLQKIADGQMPYGYSVMVNGGENNE